MSCCKMVVLSAALVSMAFCAREVRAGILLAEDFASDNGGFTVVNAGGPTGPWTYIAGLWRTDGTDNLGTPSSSALRSPTIVTTSDGPVTLSFSHRYSFEKDTTVWDGGQVQISVNGGPYAAVPGASFTANGYTDTIAGNNALTGQSGYSGDSPGYGAASLITSVASLGSFTAGDSITLQFLGAWDEFSKGAVPNWVIDSAEVSAVPEPSATALALFLLAGTSTYALRRFRLR